MRDFYKVLGVKRTATPTEIKTAYRILIRQYHPDYNRNDEVAVAMTKMINDAYAVLSDPTKRKQFDSSYVEPTHYDAEELKHYTDLAARLRGSAPVAARLLDRLSWWFEDLSKDRKISLWISLIYLVMALFHIGGPIVNIWLFVAFVPLALVLIWFGDIIGSFTGYGGRVQIDVATPGGYIKGFGWVMMGLPLFIVYINHGQFPP